MRALLLDLDGTLLDLDGDEFLEAYAQVVADWMAPLMPPARFTEALWSAAIPLMVNEHPGVPNRVALWNGLAQALDVPADRLEQTFLDGLAHHDLTSILPGGHPSPGAHRLIAAARKRRLKVAVATMPIYPRIVVDERLRRARLDRVDWDAVATYDMHAVKPHPSYWRELADDLATEPDECLVVGDDYFRDMSARRTGMQTFYVGPAMPGLDTGPHGSLEELATRLEADLWSLAGQE